MSHSYLSPEDLHDADTHDILLDNSRQQQHFLSPDHQQGRDENSDSTALTDIRTFMASISTRLDGFDNRLARVEQPPPGPPPPIHSSTAPDRQHQETVPASVTIHRPPRSRQDPPLRDMPPHLSRQTVTTTPRTTAITTPVVPRDVFRALPKEEKITFRRVCELMGKTTWEFLDTVDASQLTPDTVRRAAQGRPSHSPSRRTPSIRSQASVIDEEDDDDGYASTPVTNGQGLASVTRPDSGGEVLHSPITTQSSNIPHTPSRRRDSNSSHHHRPTNRHRHYRRPSRVRSVLRTNDHPEWEPAVVRAIAVALKGHTAIWHEGLSKIEAAELKTVESWEHAMRDAFPVNIMELRREARDRRWEPTKEKALQYYFDKLRALRQAFGDDQSERALVIDIKANLPSELLTLMRLSRENPTLHELRKELGEAEPHFRAMHKIQLSPASPPDTPTTPTTTLPPSVRKAVTPAMVRSASAPTTPVPSATPSTSRSTALGFTSLADTYDPKRVTPATNGRPRSYKRPDRDTIMTLDRPCRKCGQDHFNFEHDHLAPQVRTLVRDEDDYPEVEARSEDASHQQDAQHFGTSAMTLN
ncbi:hypothetical protein A4X13_0g6511 [Tilletia indica]|uniref:Uncharacterized protein n=1 Tax=Tilletia indica TaxID=43049 RepID=A0A177T864_9BASI|nr:hypothetical protein A4X13_0g6511 [Tilletia indica]